MTPVRPQQEQVAGLLNEAKSRRRFLRGLGACVALPALESLLTQRVEAASAMMARAPGVTANGAAKRVAFVYFPNGANQKAWWPTEPGRDFALSATMQPLSPVKDQILVLGGLDHQNATGGKDGPGDHARASSTFLTGVRVKKTSGADIRAGISIDQVAARHIGHLSRFPSMELTCDGVRKSGSCDSGYSCAYDYNMSWRTPNMPMAPEPNPRLVFERLFGGGDYGDRRKNFAERQSTQKSILDFVLEDARQLQTGLAEKDRGKLDEYLSSIREIETRLQRAEASGETPDPNVDTPKGIPASHREHVRLMYDMMALAFQTDSTRIATLILAHDGSNRAFPEIGIPEGHHSISHHQGKKDNLEKIAKIDLFYMEEFARFLGQLATAKDADGSSVLDNSMIVYGCGNGDGNRHNHDNLPVILAGRAGGSLQSNAYLKMRGKPMSNLFLSMLDHLGVQGETRFGDSTGRLEGI